LIPQHIISLMFFLFVVPSLSFYHEKAMLALCFGQILTRQILGIACWLPSFFLIMPWWSSCCMHQVFFLIMPWWSSCCMHAFVCEGWVQFGPVNLMQYWCKQLATNSATTRVAVLPLCYVEEMTIQDSFTGQLDATVLTPRTSWRWVCHGTRDILAPKCRKNLFLQLH